MSFITPYLSIDTQDLPMYTIFMDRFWKKVEIRDDNLCWEWKAFKTKRFSYGLFRFGPRMMNAHRASWIIANGPIPKGMCILHICDNPPCVNPRHLKLGTQADNIRDMVSKGRVQRHNAKKTHCIRGHIYAGENLKINKLGHRKCRACDRLAHRKKI